jgi:tetratricopeptide (TPR) repeat protein
VLVRILILPVALLLLSAAAVGVLVHATPKQERPPIERVVRNHVEAWAESWPGDAEDSSEVAAEAAEFAVSFGRRIAAPQSHLALLAAGVLLLAFSLWPRPRAAEIEPETEGGLGAAEESVEVPKRELKRVLKLAKQVEMEEGPEMAGNFLIGQGLRDEACELFEAHDLVERAAEVRHDQNRFDEAAELFRKAGRWEAAGGICAQLERHEDAARCYLKADKRSVAGELFERAENYLEAGRCYGEIGFHRQAAQAFLKADARAEAAEALIQAFDEEGGGRAGTEEKQREVRGIAKKAGELLVELERFDEAESILQRAGALGAAAKVAFQQGAYDRAADLFARVGRGDLAAKALDKLGDTVGAASARGAYLRDKGEDEAAIIQFEAAGEFEDAADLCRKLLRFSQAGELYLKGGDGAAAAGMFCAADEPARAASAYADCGEFAKAAEAYAQAGEPAEQAEALEKSGDLFAAGRQYAQLDRTDDAIRVLQRIGQDHTEFGLVCALLGELFERKGMHSLSVSKLQEAISDCGGVSAPNLEAHFHLARALEKTGELAAAAEIYERILSFDYHYKDVAGRIEQLKTQVDAQSAAPPEATPGRYQVQSELGRGGMGVVYLARDTVLERDVAYKVLPEQLRGNANALRSFLREAKAAAKLNHPNIVTVFDAGESEHGCYLAMELVEGTTLKDVVLQRGAISAGGVVYILRQMAEALAYAHSKGVVHRDIKTANTMWTPDKQVKIMDFGLARLMEEVRNATTVVSGTPFYMSPEQTLGKNIDHRTDLYSLGVTLFELATGQLPFRRGNVPYHHVHTPPPDPRTVKSDLPQALSLMILRCLEKSPDARYGSAGEILAELDRLSSKAK